MANLTNKADLIAEVKQLREDLSLLNKVVCANRRLIAFLEYTRSSSSWSYVPSQAGSIKGEPFGAASTGVKNNPSSVFQVVPYTLLASHVLRVTQL